jgi:hypothetical protein
MPSNYFAAMPDSRGTPFTLVRNIHFALNFFICCNAAPLILLPSLNPFSYFPLFVLQLELTLAPPR